jgi:hypothetical protein
MTTPTPKRDIGPIYQILAGIALLVALGVALLHAHKDHPIGLYDVLFLAVIAVLCMALWRPESLDNLFKTIADKIPFLRFEKPKGE